MSYKWVAEAREHIRNMFSNLPAGFSDAAKETVVDLLCTELEKIPVPFVGTILSKTVKSTLKSGGGGGPSVQNVIDLLREMEQSDDAFASGFSQLGEDVDSIDEQIRYIREEIQYVSRTLTVPKPKIGLPKYIRNYPVEDNEIQFSLCNIGAGVIHVPEIKLLIESWEPSSEIDYSVPAAPPTFLKLKAELSPEIAEYNLLALNNEPFREYGAQGTGIERICIQMSSAANCGGDFNHPLDLLNWRAAIDDSQGRTVCNTCR